MPAPGMYLYSIFPGCLGVALQVVSMPDDQFAGYFRMPAKKLQSIRGGSGIVFLAGEFRGLNGGLRFVPSR